MLVTPRIVQKKERPFEPFFFQRFWEVERENQAVSVPNPNKKTAS